VTIHLMRHAHAGKRSEWTGDDQMRPLSSRGLAQAIHLRDVIGDAPVGRIVSSPFVRCIQTVDPLAAHLGLMIEEHKVFSEGMGGDEAYRLLLDLDEVDGVVCSHGDVIPSLLRRLVADGMDTDGPLIDQKGSIWMIELRNGHPFRGRYVPPLA
jgi:phosphohistidine phosphatase SixA